MNWLVIPMRKFATWWFKRRGLATIQGIETDRLGDMLRVLQGEGWNKTFEYAGPDAWIDYACVRLKRDRIILKFEWDNWDEGSVEGPEPVIRSVAERFGYTSSRQPRWTQSDH